MKESIKVTMVVLGLVVISISLLSIPTDAEDVGNQASIGNTEYPTFEEAFNAALDSQQPVTIKLLADVKTSNSFDMQIPQDADLTFDLNGYTLEYSVWNYESDYIHNLGTLTITDSSTNDVSQSGRFGFYTFMSAGTLNIENGRVAEGNSDFKWGLYAAGTLNISGGSLGLFSSLGELNITGGQFREILCYDVKEYGFESSVDISGGTFSGPISVLNVSEGGAILNPQIDISVTGGEFTYDIRDTYGNSGIIIANFVPDSNEFLKADGLYRVVDDIDEIIGDYSEVTILDDRENLSIPAGSNITLDTGGCQIGKIDNSGNLILMDSSGKEVVSVTEIVNNGAGNLSVISGNYGEVSSEGILTVSGGSFETDVSSSLSSSVKSVDVGDGRYTIASTVESEASLAKTDGLYFTSLVKAMSYAKHNSIDKVEIVRDQDYDGLGVLDMSGITLDLCQYMITLNYSYDPEVEFPAGSTVFTGDDFTITNGGIYAYAKNIDMYGGYALYIGSSASDVKLEGIWVNGVVSIGDGSSVTADDCIFRGYGNNITPEFSIRVSDNAILDVYESTFEHLDVLGEVDRFTAGSNCSITFHSGRFDSHFALEYLEQYIVDGSCLVNNRSYYDIVVGENYEVKFYTDSRNPTIILALMGTAPEYIGYIPTYEDVRHCWTFEDGSEWDEVTPLNGDTSLYEVWKLTTPVTITSSDADPSIGEEITLTASCDYEDGTWTWYKDGVAVADNKTDTLKVSESGSYSAKIEMNSYPRATATASYDVFYSGGTVTFEIETQTFTVTIDHGKVNVPANIDYSGHEGQVIAWSIGGQEWSPDVIVNDGDTIVGTWFTPIAEIDGKQYDSLQAALDAVSTDGTQTTIKLVNNTSLDSTIFIKDGKNVVLDLNGNNITWHGTSRNPVISVVSTLSVVGGGSIDAGTGDGEASAAIWNNGNGVLTVDDGVKLTNGNQATVYSVGKLILGNVTIENDNGDGASFHIPVYMMSNGSFTSSAIIDGATITNNGSTAAVYGDGNLEIRDGTITGGSNAVMVYSGSTEISGGTISAPDMAINVGDGSLTITGGTISSDSGNQCIQVSDLTKGTASISGGSFSSEIPDEYISADSALISDGKGGYTAVSGDDIDISADGRHTLSEGQTLISDGVHIVTIDYSGSTAGIVFNGTTSKGEVSISVMAVATPHFVSEGATYAILIEYENLDSDSASITVSIPMGSDQYLSGCIVKYYDPSMSVEGEIPSESVKFNANGTVTFVTTHSTEYDFIPSFGIVEPEPGPEPEPGWDPGWNDDDDYVPLPPNIVYEDDEDDETVKVVACAAAVVVAAMMVVLLILTFRRK